ncbi:hypothetical protein D3C73_1556270 [compost metagenome]
MNINYKALTILIFKGLDNIQEYRVKVAKTIGARVRIFSAAPIKALQLQGFYFLYF